MNVAELRRGLTHPGDYHAEAIRAGAVIPVMVRRDPSTVPEDVQRFFEDERASALADFWEARAARPPEEHAMKDASRRLALLGGTTLATYQRAAAITNERRLEKARSWQHRYDLEIV